MASTETMVSVERTGKNAKGAVVSGHLVPRLRDCRRRVTIDWQSNQVLEDLDMKGGHGHVQRRWPAHVAHTETFFVFPSSAVNTAFSGAQVTIKDTLAKEINVWKLPEEQQNMFLKDAKRGRLKEWLSVKESGAVQVHEGEIARRIREELKERCVPSRWLDKWKVAGPVAQHGLTHSQGNWVDPRIEAKSRWIVQGFHDPDIDLVSRSVPTPATGDVPMALQLMSSFGIQAWTADCKSAFMQSDPGQRPQPLFALPPSDGLPGEQKDCIIELKTEVYGLVSGPGGWRCTLLRRWQKLNWRRHPLAPCVFLFFEDVPTSQKPQLTGVLVVETDDLLGGSSGPQAAESITQLTKSLVLGHFEYLQKRAVAYGGRLLKQAQDMSFTISMANYVAEKATAVQLERGRQDEDDATEREITCLRGLLGSLMWAGREGIPHLVGECSLLSSTLPTPKVKHIKAANACLKRHLNAPVEIRILPLRPETLHFVVLTDASFDNLGNGRTQVGWMVLACERQLVTKGEGKVSPLTFGSSALHRAASSTLCCEAFAMSMGLSHAEWAMEWWKLATDCQYDLRQRTQNPHDIEVKALMHDPGAKPPKLLAVTDAKSLFDTVNKESYSHTERRAALEVSVIRDSLKLLEGQIRWVPHALNAADSMTKLGANAQSMVRLLEGGCLQLRSEESVLAERKQFREETGRQCPRPHRKM
eukprot:905357-Amphidinium_carterae.2